MKAMTWSKYMRLVDEGRGQGHWDGYLPWLWIHRKNASPESNQSVTSLPGYSRGAHFYSRMEKIIAYICKWIGGDRVDLREQFPLWPMPHVHPLVVDVPTWREPTVRGLWEIAEEAGIPHGVEPGSSGVPYVASMDEMLTIDECRLRGLSLKPHDRVTLAEPTDRLLERQELERLYMREVDGTMKIIDASIFNIALRTNVSMLAGASWMIVPRTAQVEDFFGALQRCQGIKMSEALSLAATYASVPMGEAHEWFYAGVWHHRIDVDMSKHFDPEQPIAFGREMTDRLSIELFGEVL